MDRLFVANKPVGLSSNAFLSKLKKKYKVKKAGFSGTLDPFASGCLLVAFNKYAKLFRFLQTEPKSYECVMWLGAYSPSFDTQNIEVKQVKDFDKKELLKEVLSLQGILSYKPPKFSAKKINGVRAYKLARQGEDFELKETTMQVYKVEFLAYNHPFLTLRLEVSKGAYIRSYSQLLAKKLGVCIALCTLTRLKEGSFVFEGEKALNPLKHLNLKENFIKNENLLDFGKKIALCDLKLQEDGDYFIQTKDYFSVISVRNKEVLYHLNKVGKC